MERAGTQLEGTHGRAGLIRALALRGAEEISRKADSDIQARARAIDDLLACDFSRLSDIVGQRESDLADRLMVSPQQMK